MTRSWTTMLALAAALALPVSATAEIYMCVDEATGRTSFTDHACPDQAPRKAVKVEPTNFGNGIASRGDRGVWNSDRDRSVAGTANFDGERHIGAAKAVGASLQGR